MKWVMFPARPPYNVCDFALIDLRKGKPQAQFAEPQKGEFVQFAVTLPHVRFAHAARCRVHRWAIRLEIFAVLLPRGRQRNLGSGACQVSRGRYTSHQRHFFRQKCLPIREISPLVAYSTIHPEIHMER